MNISAPAAAVAEMERNMSLNEDILRMMTLRIEEMPEGPSIQMRATARSDRPDRSDRGDRGGDRGADRGGDRGGDRGERRERRDAE